MKSPRAESGFTLVELLVVVAIFGIVAALAIPSFRDYALQRAIAAQITDLAGTIREVRSEAIKRGRELAICPSENIATSPTPGCSFKKDWSKGYIVFAGTLSGNARDNQYLRVQQPHGDRAGALTADSNVIRFHANGMLKLDSAKVFTFAPPLETNDRSYKRLTKKMCLSTNGVLSSC